MFGNYFYVFRMMNISYLLLHSVPVKQVWMKKETIKITNQ